MKNLLLIICISLAGSLNAQKIGIEVSSDSILLGNYFICTFSMENIEGEFETPSLHEFDIISGPNYSNSFQSINGQTSSSKTIKYYLKPKSMGEAFIPPAYVVTDSLTYETEAITITTLPNPEGIIENPSDNAAYSFNSFEFSPFQKPIKKQPKKKKSKSPNKQRKL